MRERRLERLRHHIIFGIALLMSVLGIFVFWSQHLPFHSSLEINRGDLFLIMLPTLCVFPLWIGGLDRLHKFYSELQARIAGNILRLEATTEQKFIDLLSDDTAACAMKAKFKSTVAARKSLDTLLKDRNCKSDSGGGDPPAGDQASAAANAPGGNGSGAAAGGNTGGSAPPSNGGGD